jgi:hypothetical protein
MNRHQWGEIHFWVAFVLMAVLALHVVLHWKWIVTVVRGRRPESSGWRVALGVVGLAGLLGLCAAPFLSEVESTGTPGRHQRAADAGQRGGEQASDGRSAPPRQGDTVETTDSHDNGESIPHVRGSMTLAELEDATGVAVEVVLRELGLPSNTPPEEKLGRLSHQYGFEMDDVRGVIAKHSSQP